SGPCKAGFYCQGRAVTPVRDVCPAGSYCPPGSPFPVPCPPGTYSNTSGLRNLWECLDCPPGDCPEGTFCNETGLAAPQDCPKGHFCLAGSSLPLPCPVGTYTDVTRSGSCKPCPAGMFCSLAALTQPEGHCQPGHYCIQGSSTSSPVKGLRHRCPPGFYCPQKTGISFYPCPPGTYNPSYGLSQAERCQQCPPG
ncbi:AB24G protein, partial [Oreotrochilus melanogaster]|nr:AB24G protein [Oreotrochilus melanogaster]